MHNTKRLQLLIMIGLTAAQARAHKVLDEISQVIASVDTHDDPHFFRYPDVWLEAQSGVIQLAKLDHLSDFSPGISPMLSEFGLLTEYWDARHRLDPEPESHDEY